jgi:hypothetical protein
MDRYTIIVGPAHNEEGFKEYIKDHSLSGYQHVLNKEGTGCIPECPACADQLEVA